MSGKVHDTPAEAIAANKKKLYPKGQKFPGKGVKLAGGITKLRDGRYSIVSSYRSDKGPLSYRKGVKPKVHYFEEYEDAINFKKGERSEFATLASKAL